MRPFLIGSGTFFSHVLLNCVLTRSLQGLEVGFFGLDITNHKVTLYSSGVKRFNATTRSTVADAIVAVLRNPGTENRYLSIADITTSQIEMLSELEAQTGRQWLIAEQDAGEYHARGDALWNQGDIPGAARHWLVGNMFADGHGTLVESLDNEVLGLKPRTLEDVVHEVLVRKGAISERKPARPGRSHRL